CTATIGGDLTITANFNGGRPAINTPARPEREGPAAGAALGLSLLPGAARARGPGGGSVARLDPAARRAGRGGPGGVQRTAGGLRRDRHLAGQLHRPQRREPRGGAPAEGARPRHLALRAAGQAVPGAGKPERAGGRARAGAARRDRLPPGRASRRGGGVHLPRHGFPLTPLRTTTYGGIPMEKPKDLYVVLGVPRNASQAAIKKAFRRLAREFHPDLGGVAQGSSELQALQAAYE